MQPLQQLVWHWRASRYFAVVLLALPQLAGYCFISSGEQYSLSEMVTCYWHFSEQCKTTTKQLALERGAYVSCPCWALSCFIASGTLAEPVPMPPAIPLAAAATSGGASTGSIAEDAASTARQTAAEQLQQHESFATESKVGQGAGVSGCPLGLAGCVDCFRQDQPAQVGQCSYSCDMARPFTRSQAVAHALQEQAYAQGSSDNLAVLAIDLHAVQQQQLMAAAGNEQLPAARQQSAGFWQEDWGLTPHHSTDAAVGMHGKSAWQITTCRTQPPQCLDFTLPASLQSFMPSQCHSAACCNAKGCCHAVPLLGAAA